MRSTYARIVLPVVLLLPLLLTGAASAEDPMQIAGKICAGLNPERLRQATESMALWEQYETDILESVPASLKVADAFARFGSSKTVLRYLEIPGQCAEIAEKCVTAVEEKTAESDTESRVALGKILLCVAVIHRKSGHGDLAEKAEDRALTHLTAVAGMENPPAAAFVELGQLYGRMAEREPPKAEEHLASAAAAFEQARQHGGESADLCLRLGELQWQMADLKEAALAKDPKDRRLTKELVKCYEAAMDHFGSGLKLDDKDAALKTNYNECLWHLKRMNKGKAKQDPILRECNSRYRKIYFDLPDSEYWHVTPVEELDEREVFEAWKFDRKAKKGLVIWIDEYKWDTNYTDPETNETVGGDNIGGLAKSSERRMTEGFQDISERKPLTKLRMSRRIPKAQGYIIRGMTEKGDLEERRVFFFKHSGRQRTFRVMVYADLGMLGNPPYELNEILESFGLKD